MFVLPNGQVTLPISVSRASQGGLSSSRALYLTKYYHHPSPGDIRQMSDSVIRFYHHGRFRVYGGVIPDAVTAYQTYGDPNNPCIVFPTCYGAKLGLGSEYAFVPHLIG